MKYAYKDALNEQDCVVATFSTNPCSCEMFASFRSVLYIVPKIPQCYRVFCGTHREPCITYSIKKESLKRFLSNFGLFSEVTIVHFLRNSFKTQLEIQYHVQVYRKQKLVSGHAITYCFVLEIGRERERVFGEIQKNL